EHAILEPTHIQLRVIIIPTDIVARGGRIDERLVYGMMDGRKLPEAPHVIGPVRNSRSGDIQARGDLPLQRVPGGGDIGGPEYGCVALSAGERRTCQNESALARVLAHT